jgi:hypothetical protein
MRRILVLLPVSLALQVGVSPALAWTWPVDGPALQRFEFNGSPYEGGQHRGIDVAAASGTPIIAPAPGVISFAGSVPGGGRTLTIETPDGYSVTLVHLGAYSVERGASVAEGQPVGIVGPSGTPEHAEAYVHLGVRVTAEPEGYVDPLGLLPARVEPAAPEPTPVDPSPPADPAAPAEEGGSETDTVSGSSSEAGEPTDDATEVDSGAGVPATPSVPESADADSPAPPSPAEAPASEGTEATAPDRARLADGGRKDAPRVAPGRASLQPPLTTTETPRPDAWEEPAFTAASGADSVPAGDDDLRGGSSRPVRKGSVSGAPATATTLAIGVGAAEVGAATAAFGAPAPMVSRMPGAVRPDTSGSPASTDTSRVADAASSDTAGEVRTAPRLDRKRAPGSPRGLVAPLELLAGGASAVSLVCALAVLLGRRRGGGPTAGDAASTPVAPGGGPRTRCVEGLADIDEVIDRILREACALEVTAQGSVHTDVVRP